MQTATRKLVPALLGLLLALPVTIGHAALPGFRAPMLDTPSYPNAFRSALTDDPNSALPAVSTEIEELARSLRYNPGLMYGHIRNFVQTEFTWGEQKGARMTWLDRSGNSFDQATLMIRLLQEAAEHNPDLTITDIVYKVGEIELTPTEAEDWFDIDGDADAVLRTLARSGVYGDVGETAGAVDDVKLIHTWVQCKINTVTYTFDPAQKTHTFVNGLSHSTLETEMDYTGSTFRSNATAGSSGGSSPDWIKDIDETNINSDLTGFTTDLISYLEVSKPQAGLDEIITGRNIDPVDDNDVPPLSLPYTVNSYDDEFSIDEVPDFYRTTVRIQHAGIDETFYSSQIYGRRLVIQYNAQDKPELWLDGTWQATGTTITEGDASDLTLDVDSPSADTAFDSSTTVNLISGGFYTIFTGFGHTGRPILETHRKTLEQARYDDPTEQSEAVLGESYTLVGLTWLAQTSQMRQMAAALNQMDHRIVGHHMIGVAGEYGAPYMKLAAGVLGVTDIDVTDHSKEIFLTVTGHAAAYEQQVIRQLQNCNAVSNGNLLRMANARSSNDKIYQPNNSSTWTSTQSSLSGWSQAEKEMVTDYIDDGFTVQLPQYGDLTDADFTGTGFYAFKFDSTLLTASYAIADATGGSTSTSTSTPIDATDLFDNAYEGGSQGAYTASSTDIAVGSGGFPFGLSFSRRYSSHDRLKDGPLGLGWRHNYDICAKVTSDSFQALGSGSAIDAAAAIVSLYVTKDTLESNTSSKTYTMVASLIESWLMDHLTVNMITIDQGGSKIDFVKNQDGEYYPPVGAKLKIDPNETDGTIRLSDANGKFYDFDPDGLISEWSDPHGNTVEFDYTVDNKLNKVTSKIDGTALRSLTFTYTGDRITKVEDDANREVTYTYDTDGQITEHASLDGEDVTYGYDASNVGRITEVYLPTDPINPFVTNVYDDLGRIKQRTNAIDITVDSYLTPYRVEVEGPEQTDPDNETKRFSSIVWFDKYGRTTRTIDPMGRENTFAYNGVHELIESTTAFGTSTENTYDATHNLVSVQSNVRAGYFTDPNVAVSMDYDDFTNDEGRWFVRTKTRTDVIGDQTVYQYDFNDIELHGTEVGNLMKITYPDVNLPTGTVTPTETFTYNDDGRIASKTDVEGIVTEFEYFSVAQGAGLRKTIVDAGTGTLNITTEVTYDSVGRPITQEDPLGNITSLEYSDAGLLIKTTSPSPFSYETTYEYDEVGRLLKTKRKDGASHVVLKETTYTALGQVASERGPYPKNPTQAQLDINHTQYTYDDLGRPWKVEDAEGNITETRYYPDNKVWKVIDAEGNDSIVNTYNDDGTLEKVADAKGNETRYEYNGFGSNMKTIYPDGTFTEPDYDYVRRLEGTRTRSGQFIGIERNDNERVNKKVLPDNTILYTYDLAGRVLEVNDVTGVIKHTYDRIGRLTEVEDAQGHTVKYEYDEAGRRTKLTYPDDTYVTYHYDNLGRLTDIKDATPTVLALYDYDDLGRRSSVTYANNQKKEYSYDANYRLSEIQNPTNDNDHDYAYAYDNVGNRKTMTVDGSKVHTYTYDKLYQITDVDYPANYSPANDTEFNYDEASNRDQVIDTEASETDDYVANALNQYTRAGSYYLDYDRTGNLTYDGLFNYLYDAENRLIQVTKSQYGGNNTLNAAADCDLTYTTGGDADWVSTDQEYYHEGNDVDVFVQNHDSARSGVLSASQESWMQTKVQGSGTLTFHMKRLGDGTGTFSIDGENKHTGSGNWGWDELSYSVDGVGEHTFKWKYARPSSTTSDPNGLWVDYVQWQPDESRTQVQQALENDHPFTGWSRYITTDAYHDGDCAESDDSIGHSEESTMEMKALGSGTFTFYWSVSSEQNGDYLKFYIDGTLKDSISGEVAWEQKSYTVTGTGEHTFKWVYKKNPNSSEGDDRGLVDYVQWDGSYAQSLTTAIATDSDDAEEEPDGTIDLSGDLYLGTDSGDDIVVGLRFTDLQIPQGALITNAYVEFEAVDDDTDYCEVKIEAEDTDDASTFTTTNGDITSRTTTTASVSYWKPNDWGEPNKYQTSDLSALVQEVVDRTGWSSGNDLALIFTGNDGTRRAESSTGYNTYPPVLRVEFVRTGIPDDWETIQYAHDHSGRRIEKNVDHTITRYVYDGGNVLAEYTENGEQLRKYLYGPDIDEPISMTEVIDSNAVYYYHTDGLGSVVALTDSVGNSVQTYKYSVYGLVSAADADHTNPYMFAGRRFDVETGLYYNRARYYNPYIGRFMQTDPIGYGDGMNWYAYTGNNPIGRVDPAGTISIRSPRLIILDPVDLANHLYTVYCLANRRRDMYSQISLKMYGNEASASTEAIFWQGPVSMGFLMDWYLFAGGKTLNLRGDPVDTILRDDLDHPHGRFMKGLVGSISGMINNHRLNPEAFPSHFSFTKPLQFPGLRAAGISVLWALGGAHGAANISGHIKTYEGEDGGTKFRAEFTVSWVDVGDLHPESYHADRVCRLAEGHYNTVYRQYFGNTRAQSYPITLVSSLLGIELEIDKEGQIISGGPNWGRFTVIRRWTLEDWEW